MRSSSRTHLRRIAELVECHFNSFLPLSGLVENRESLCVVPIQQNGEIYTGGDVAFGIPGNEALVIVNQVSTLRNINGS